MTAAPTLAQLVRAPDILVAPGVYDALGVLLAQQAGFSAAYVSGAGIAYSRFGRPDIGLVSMSEVAACVSAISERVELPLIVDADTGFGNALNVMRTVRLLERNGAGAIQLEDQSLPKRCGHLAGKTLVTVSEMVGKIEAALDARRSEATLIVARTDAIAVDGLDAAIDRAGRYADAGADVLFVEAPRSRDEMQGIVAALGGAAPLLANMVEGGATPSATAVELEAMGYALVIFPGGLVRAFAATAQAYFASLAEHGSNDPFRDRMLDFRALNTLLDTERMLWLGRDYDGVSSGDGED